MTDLADIVILERVKPEDVREAVVLAVNLAWQADGENGRCNLPANFVGWLVQENDRLRAAREKLLTAP